MTSDEEIDLQAVKRAWEAATPRPDPAVRDAHLRQAQESFGRTQGSRLPQRQSSEGPVAGLWQGVKTMLTGWTAPRALSATTALVACGLLLISPLGEDLWQGATRLRPEGEPQRSVETEVAETEAAETGSFETGGTETAGAEAEPAPPVASPDGAMLSEAAPEAQVAPRALEAARAPEGGAALTAPASATAPAPDATGDAAADRAMDAGPATASESPVQAPVPAPSPESRVGSDAAAAFGEMGAVPPFATPDTEAFSNAPPSSLKVTAQEPVSTFSIDVDTASWSILRSSILRGQRPPAEAVRVEEMVNYFSYDYPAPDAGAPPLRSDIAVMPTPWNDGTRLVRIGLQARMPAVEARPPLNLVFLIDTSGSMEDPAKLPLLKQSLALMLGELRPQDEVAVVAYAGSAGLVLPATPAAERGAILAALDRLSAGGSTNGQGGLEQAYAVAQEMAAEGEVGRVILATDGDFNVGVSDPGGLTAYVAGQRESGTYLSVLGFGRGNLDDAVMQALAQNGNGQAAYIDTLVEAQKVLVDQLTGALFPVAGDVKVQVEWNPATIAEYRLIGYETRALAREDFANDRVDAGEVGAGHQVTALYEVTPVGSPARLTAPLRYGPDTEAEAATAPGEAGELGFLRLRWKAPGEQASQLMEMPIADGAAEAGAEAEFAAAIAGFGQLLRGSDYVSGWSFEDAAALAEASRGVDPFGYRSEAVRLIRLAGILAE